MNAQIRRLGRAALFGLLTISLFSSPAPGQENPAELPFHLKVKKAEFEKRARAGVSQVLKQYELALDAIGKRQFAAESAEGVLAVKKEQDQIGKYLKQIDGAEPLVFIANRLGRLNRGEVELESRLSDSVWTLSDGRELKLRGNRTVAFDGRVASAGGWEVADGEHFIFGPAFWKAEVRDKNRRFTATAPKIRKPLQGVFFDSVEYSGSPQAMMAHEFGKMKLQLAGGLKTLIGDFAASLDQMKQSAIQASNLEEANAHQKEWERLYEATGLLFGDELDLGDPSDAVRPLYQSAEELRAALIGSVWNLPGSYSLALDKRGGARILSEAKTFPPIGWELIDRRTMVYGDRYYRVRFDPKITSFSGGSRKSRQAASGTLDQRNRP